MRSCVNVIIYLTVDIEILFVYARCCNVSYRKWSLSLSIDIGSLCNQPGFSVNAGFGGLVDEVRVFDMFIVPIYNALNV